MRMLLNHEGTKTRSFNRAISAHRSLLVFFLRVFVPSWFILFSPVHALANPTQEEVFKSIQDNVGGTVDPKKFFGFICGVGGIVVLLAVISNRKKREVTPKVFNHQGKLLKEILRRVNLRPVEIRQLKMLADSQGLASPLTLLLCPSVLAKAVKERTGKVDRQVILSVARKLG